MEWQQVALVCCFVPLVVLLIAGFLIVRNLSRFLRMLTQFTAPDTADLHRQYEKMRAANPNATQQQLVRRIINQYAVRQGIVGALTSVGGFIALPIGLLLDLTYSARSNAALSFFIAQVYGIRSETEALNLVELFVLRDRTVSPNDLAMWQEQFAGVAYQQLTRWALRKTVAKIIPFAGAIVGFLVNYSSVQLFGRLADQYYNRHSEKLKQ